MLAHRHQISRLVLYQVDIQGYTIVRATRAHDTDYRMLWGPPNDSSRRLSDRDREIDILTQECGSSVVTSCVGSSSRALWVMPAAIAIPRQPIAALATHTHIFTSAVYQNLARQTTAARD